MERHLSHTVLAEIFSGQAEEVEVASALPHLARCRSCWDAAGRAVAVLERSGRLAQPADARSAVIALFAEEERQARSCLLARAAWTALRGLSPEEQLVRIKADSTLRTQAMFDTILEEAVNVAPQDPFAGEETALLAHELAGILSLSAALRNDLQSEAMAVVGNCRRLAADWRGSAEAFRLARGHLKRGARKPAREARLLSMEASLATDTGHLEQAEVYLARAAALYRNAGDPAALTAITVKEASTLLAAYRHEEAIARAEEVLRTSRSPRLEMLARNIITASLVFLGRPAAALRSYFATRPLCEQLPGTRTDLQAEYLGALLLDSLGYVREAEKAFRSTIAGFMDAELYKDSFLILLTQFELLFQRGEFERAARACEEALALLQQPHVACHNQMENLWRDLLALVQARRLTQHQLLAARRYLARHWSVPARNAPLEGTSFFLLRETVGRTTLPLVASEPAEAPAPLPGPVGDDYETALERCDCMLIEVGLAQCGGRIAETSRLLGIARNTLRAKLTKYGLPAGITKETSDQPGEDLDMLREDDREALCRLRARAWWTELRSLSKKEQLARIETVQALQTRELFETILEEASASALNDPHRGEESAVVGYMLAGRLSESRFPKPVKNDLQGAALGVVGNSRRLSGNWQGSAAAFFDAQSHLDRGTGDPARQARLLSFRASLAADMGHHEKALALLANAAAFYRSIQEDAGVTFTAIKEASTLLAANRHEAAVARAEETLRLLTPRDTRLEILARNIVTASFVYLGRPTEALRSLHATRPLFEMVGGHWSRSQLGYLEALVLDSLGYEREAETAFRIIVAGLMESGSYKNAFLTLLTRVELLFRRGALDKASLACTEAIALMEGAGEGRHVQTIALFRDLQALIDTRRLTESGLLETQHALMRCWAAPAPAAPPPKPAVEEPQVRLSRGRSFLAPEPPPRPDRLNPGDYEAEMERYERQVIEAGLAQGHGRIAEACRLLGISRNTLRERMRRYGIGKG